jgi:hypothetical protein
MLFILVNGVPSVSKIVRVASCSDVVASTAISASVPAGFLKNRYLSFKPGNPGFTTTCRVTCENLPGAFASFNGTSLYVQEPKEVCEIGGTAVVSGGNCDGNPTFRAATLACTPYPFDWGTINELHVYHELIVPGGQYAVRMGGAGCTSLPSALAISTAPWGDIGSVFDVTCTLTDCWKAPDEVVDVITDVTACLSKFANRAKAPIKARADVEPATLDFKVNISDVTSILGQFRGLPYPFPPPPPSQCPG